jgi:hypothetical protein
VSDHRTTLVFVNAFWSSGWHRAGSRLRRGGIQHHGGRVIGGSAARIDRRDLKALVATASGLRW